MRYPSLKQVAGGAGDGNRTRVASLEDFCRGCAGELAPLLEGTGPERVSPDRASDRVALRAADLTVRGHRATRPFAD